MYMRISSTEARRLAPAQVGRTDRSVTLRAAVPVRIKARFAGNGRSLAKKRNAEELRTVAPGGPPHKLRGLRFARLN